MLILAISGFVSIPLHFGNCHKLKPKRGELLFHKKSVYRILWKCQEKIIRIWLELKLKNYDLCGNNLSRKSKIILTLTENIPCVSLRYVYSLYLIIIKCLARKDFKWSGMKVLKDLSSFHEVILQAFTRSLS